LAEIGSSVSKSSQKSGAGVIALQEVGGMGVTSTALSTASGAPLSGAMGPRSGSTLRR
jgi:hypothetical protein